MKKIIVPLMFTAVFAILLFAGRALTQSTESNHADKVTGPFSTPQDVTKACLECHEDKADEFITTGHWNWLGKEYDHPGKGKVRRGKMNIVNNFCTSVISNEDKCSSCHPSYGWKDGSFDFSNKENIDCLVCHAKQENYSRNCETVQTDNISERLLVAAQSVGKTSTENCGFCHFYGGSGDNVKHGDLNSSLVKPTKDTDVHMGGKKFTCTSCHKTEKHEISGAGHSSMATGINHIGCTDCHAADDKLHKNKLIGKHLNSVACQTCHIAEVAREIPTVTYWDWSTAGLKEDVRNDEGYLTYSKLRGEMTLQKNLEPTYRWCNGSAEYYTIGDKVDPSSIVPLNKLNGDIKDAKAKIYPFKLMKAKQIYDKVNNYLIIAKLTGAEGFWKKFDWAQASELGMKAANLEYSGEYSFLETEMYFPINHSVMPKEKALKCQDCHNNGKRMDWAALGFAGDPIKKGGRGKNGFVKF